MYPIELKNVSFVYGAGEPYEIRALDNINLQLGGSMMTGFMGHTGSGKSTLVQLLNGILKPTSGQVLLDGKDIYSRDLSTGKDAPVVIVIGNESEGISSGMAAKVSDRLYIPPYPRECSGSESLNAAVATAITVAEFRRRDNV